MVTVWITMSEKTRTWNRKNKRVGKRRKTRVGGLGPLVLRREVITGVGGLGKKASHVKKGTEKKPPQKGAEGNNGKGKGENGKGSGQTATGSRLANAAVPPQWGMKKGLKAA